jgi:UDPglucose 6-dehydrogenase
VKIGILGLGKLGLPVALAIESKGHEVAGYDINPKIADYLKERQIPYKEKDLQPLLDNTKLKLENIDQLVNDSDIIFCAIQTPHEPQFEGATRLPEKRRDFDYSYLLKAITDVAESAEKQNKNITLVVISTCLPGTDKRDIEPLLNRYVHYVYNPFFIAMGTVLYDFLHPEFVLIGNDNGNAGQVNTLQEFYKTLHDSPHLVTDITTAEAIKVSYNTFITMKTVLANTWGELAHKVGANVDDIYKAWSLSTDRLMSPKYLKAGVGDGGGCHPRDNIALSWLAKEVNLSHNLFEDLMLSREQHMEWLAKQATALAVKNQLPIVVLGRSFKPETNIETGSPAILLANILKESGQVFEHEEDFETTTPAVFVIATQHDRYRDYAFPKGSVVLDPFRYIPKLDGVEVVAIGA